MKTEDQCNPQKELGVLAGQPEGRPESTYRYFTKINSLSSKRVTYIFIRQKEVTNIAWKARGGGAMGD